MGADEDADCVGHVWQITGVALLRGGAHTEYVCVRCKAVLFVAPRDVMPGTV